MYNNNCAMYATVAFINGKILIYDYINYSENNVGMTSKMFIELHRYKFHIFNFILRPPQSCAIKSEMQSI
jgi:hypothetical protein